MSSRGKLRSVRRTWSQSYRLQLTGVAPQRTRNEVNLVAARKTTRMIPIDQRKKHRPNRRRPQLMAEANAEFNAWPPSPCLLAMFMCSVSIRTVMFPCMLIYNNLMSGCFKYAIPSTSSVEQTAHSKRWTTDYRSFTRPFSLLPVKYTYRLRWL
jgi:hypothetical protein